MEMRKFFNRNSTEKKLCLLEHGQKTTFETAEVYTLRILTREDYLGLLEWCQCNHKSIKMRQKSQSQRKTCVNESTGLSDVATSQGM